MIIKSFELQKIKSSHSSIILIYGNNEGIKEQIIEDCFLKEFKGDIISYEGIDVLNNKDEFRERFTFVTEPVLHTLSKFKSIKGTRKHFCYMLKAHSPCFYQRKYSCMRCKPCRSFKTVPFSGKVKCERESICGKWKNRNSFENEHSLGLLSLINFLMMPKKRATTFFYQKLDLEQIKL